jgi:hypothetical protein
MNCHECGYDMNPIGVFGYFCPKCHHECWPSCEGRQRKGEEAPKPKPKPK